MSKRAEKQSTVSTIVMQYNDKKIAEKKSPAAGVVLMTNVTIFKY